MNSSGDVEQNEKTKEEEEEEGNPMNSRRNIQVAVSNKEKPFKGAAGKQSERSNFKVQNKQINQEK